MPSGKDASVDDVQGVAVELSGEFRAFLVAVREVASGQAAESAVPMLLLALTRVASVGARLGAMTDIVPVHRFEPDSGDDPDIEPVVQGLKELMNGIDEYAHVDDPTLTPNVVAGTVSDDIADVVSGITHGLRHYESGEVTEALWWWQFSYLSSWGDSALSGARALVSLMAHLRLDADSDTVAEAEFDALHA